MTSLRPALKIGWARGCHQLSKGSLAPRGERRFRLISTNPDLRQMLKRCGSGLELIESGFDQDVEIASELDVGKWKCEPTYTSPHSKKLFIIINLLTD